MSNTEHTLSYSDYNEIKNLLIGHKVTKVDKDTLLIDSGIKLQFEDMYDCCAYYDLTELNDTDNIITDVKFFEDPSGDDYPHGSGVYQIFVFADNKKVNLVRYEGTDSNGYYGTGYTIRVII